MRRLLVVVGVVGLLGLLPGPALAQQPHEHMLTVPGTGESVKVGPPRCDVGAMLQASFLNFHGNVHLGTPTSSGGLTLTPVFCP